MSGLPNPKKVYKCSECGCNTSGLGCKFLVKGDVIHQGKDQFIPVCSDNCRMQGVKKIKCYYSHCPNRGVFESSMYCEVGKSQFTFPACSSKCTPLVKEFMNSSLCAPSAEKGWLIKKKCV